MKRLLSFWSPVGVFPRQVYTVPCGLSACLVCLFLGASLEHKKQSQRSDFCSGVAFHCTYTPHSMLDQFLFFFWLADMNCSKCSNVYLCGLSWEFGSSRTYSSNRHAVRKRSLCIHFPAEHADSQSPPSIGGIDEPMGQVMPLNINATFTDRIFVENNFFDLLYGRVDLQALFTNSVSIWCSDGHGGMFGLWTRRLWNLQCRYEGIIKLVFAV